MTALAGRLLGTNFPYGTLTVNVIGSLLMGVAVALLVDRIDGAGPATTVPLVMTGFLGGFTTFSAFSLDAYLLLEDGRIGAMFAYGIASVLVSLAALAVGITFARVLL